MGSHEACLDHLLQVIRTGGIAGLLDELRANPINTLYCVLTVLRALTGEHDHDPAPPVIGDSPRFANAACELATELGQPVPAGADPSTALPPVVVNFLIKWLTDWLLERLK